MLKKYFYTKFLDLYLCYLSTQQEENCEDRISLARQINTVRDIAQDLIGGESACEAQHEARTDAASLRENKLYYIPSSKDQTIALLKKYAPGSPVIGILSKTL